jgi:hypothetical protein
MCRTPIGPIVAGVVASLALGACASSSKPSSAHVTTSAASTNVSTAHSGNTVVSIAPAVRSNPKAPTIAALLTRRYTDINQQNFADYWAMYTPVYRASFNQAEVAAGYRTSSVSDIRLTKLSTDGDGRLHATVTFTSRQDASDGPNGQTCTHWTVGFFFKKVGTAYLLDTPPNSYSSAHAAC